jgi:hypothetical protein
MRIHMKLLGVAVICHLLIGAGHASGQIYSAMYFSQEVVADAFRQSSLEDVVSTAVPIGQTIMTSTTYGGYAEATYSVTQNNTQATFDISANGLLTVSDYGAVEGNYDPQPGDATSFSFAVPVRYTISLSDSGDGGMNFYLSGGTYVNTGFADSSRQYGGIIPADAPCALSENWGLSNAGIPASQSGSDSIEMTFTPVNPIPEPSSALLIGTGAIAVLARRGRPRHG